MNKDVSARINSGGVAEGVAVREQTIEECARVVEAGVQWTPSWAPSVQRILDASFIRMAKEIRALATPEASVQREQKSPHD